MIRLLFLGIGLLAMTGCGAYFVSTGDLVYQHKEGVAPLGAWAVDDLHLVFEDGPETADQVCIIGEDNFAIWADIHMIPVERGSLVMVSNLVSSEADNIARYNGSLFYGLEHKDDDLFYVELFEHIDEGDTLPFATECPVVQDKGTLVELGFTPFCMAADITPDLIIKWALEQEKLDPSLITPLSASQTPAPCQTARPTE